MAPPSAVANTWANSAFGSGKSRLLTQDPGNSWAEGYGTTDPWADGDPGPMVGKGKGTWQDGKTGKTRKGKAQSTSTGSTSSSMLPAVPELTAYNDQWHEITEMANRSAPGPSGSRPGWEVRGAAGMGMERPVEETEFDEASGMEQATMALRL